MYLVYRDLLHRSDRIQKPSIGFDFDDNYVECSGILPRGYSHRHTKEVTSFTHFMIRQMVIEIALRIQYIIYHGASSHLSATTIRTIQTLAPLTISTPKHISPSHQIQLPYSK